MREMCSLVQPTPPNFSGKSQGVNRCALTLVMSITTLHRNPSYFLQPPELFFALFATVS